MEVVQAAAAAVCRTQKKKNQMPLSTDIDSEASSPQTNVSPISLQGDISQDALSTGQQLMLDKLPEDIFHHIYSLLPLQDAARAASVSREFLRCWRCYPNLILNERTLGWDDKKFGIGVQTLMLKLYPCSNINASYLDNWLRIAVKPGIKELFLGLCINIKAEYNFPCELLSNDAAGSSVHSIFLGSCALRPTATTLGSLRRLTSLSLWVVHINDQELGCLLSSSLALESLEIVSCNELICLKLPCTLRQFKSLKVSVCKMLQHIEIDAPKLANFQYGGAPIQISLGDLLQVKDIHLHGNLHSGMVCYARAKLPSIAPSVQSLTLSSCNETVNTPTTSSKFLRLKNLDILLSGASIFSPNYDFFLSDLLSRRFSCFGIIHPSSKAEWSAA